MSRIQLAKHSVNRTIKRKKFPHVLQVHEELGPREQRTTALENNRARPPPRTPQRKNQPSRLQTESTTEPARRSQHEDTAARQDAIPQVGYELGEISESLNSVVMEVGEATGQSYDFEASGVESQKILSDANTVAETRMREKFPELPSPALGTLESTVPR